MEANEKKKQILEVAEKLFAENGFDGTPVRSIAKKADINVAMISYYFGSKDNLLRDLMVYRSLDFRQEIKAILHRENSYKAKTDEIISFTVKHLHRNRRINKILNFEFSKDANRVDFNQFIAQKRQSYQLIEDFIKEGQAAGVFSKSVYIPLVMGTIRGIYFSLYYRKKSFTALHNLDEKMTLDDFVETHLIPYTQRTVKAILTYE